MNLEVEPSIDATVAVRERIRARLDQIRTRKKIWPHHLQTYAKDALIIRPKGAEPVHFWLNSVQEQFDTFLDNMLAEVGYVRVIVLKARQLGISTYIAARFYHRTRFNPGVRCNITTHRDDATTNLMGMVKRFRDHDPDPPSGKMKRNNETEMIFPNDSGFHIATAGQLVTGAGRSFTFQLAHWSEMAWWQNASDHLTSLMDAVPLVDGSEIIIESTANGAHGAFHAMSMAGMRGLGHYRFVFFPWFEHDEYQLEPPDGWKPGPAVYDLKTTYDLADPQLYWAEIKNSEKAGMDGDPDDKLSWRFQQEFPSNSMEAFKAARTGGYIAGSVVAAAMRRFNPHQPDEPLIFGCDFATGGGGGDQEYIQAKDDGDDIHGSEDGDSNVFISMRGRVKGRELYDRFRDRDSVSVANKLQYHMDRLRPDKVFMDKGGGGAQVYDILVRRGYGPIMELVDFGDAARPVDKRKYYNKRAEMHGDFREWLQDGDIPDDPLLDTEITATWVASEDARGLLLAKKRDVRKKLKVSPDGCDACVCCHAAPVQKRSDLQQWVAGGAG